MCITHPYHLCLYSASLITVPGAAPTFTTFTLHVSAEFCKFPRRQQKQGGRGAGGQKQGGRGGRGAEAGGKGGQGGRGAEAGGKGGICPHKNYLVGVLPQRKSAAVTDGHVNLTQQLSLCSMEQCKTVALVGFKAIV